MSDQNSKAKYWIRFTHQECPVCGRGSTYRERIYDKPKPKNSEKRHIWECSYDWCDV